MSKKKILWVSDWDLTNNGDGRTGYTNISIEYCQQLALEHTLIAVGPSYRKTPHLLPFSLSNVPFPHTPTTILSLHHHMKLDHVVVCLDIPMQRQLAKEMQKAKLGIKYTGIFAVEADPLYAPWAMDLAAMDYRFSISEFGKQEGLKAGVEMEHLVIPTDRNIWKPKTKDEQAVIKEGLGVTGKTVFFVNASGNERKNTAMVIEAMNILVNQKGMKDIYLIILSDRKSFTGWDLDELIMRFKLNRNATVLDRGISSEEVRKLYVAADFFLNVTKAEGMSFPILESMSVGTPVICTAASAMLDHSANGQAIAIPADYINIDPFGNTNRYFVFPQTLARVIEEQINLLKQAPNAMDILTTKASDYINWRNNQNSIQMLRKIFNE